MCSWYPGKTEPFNGDFIQRHARAASLFNDIYVIHVTGDATGKISGTEEDTRKSGGLTEHIIYFKRSSTPWGRLMAHYRWLAISRKAIRKYITENGEPAAVHVQVPFKAGMFAIWMKKRFGIPYVVTEHWGIYNDVELLNYSGRSKTFKRVTRSIFSGAEKFLSVSKYLAEGVNRLVVKKNYEVVPNVVDTNLFFYAGKNEPAFRFIHVSNMVPLKNPAGILRAFRNLLERGHAAELVMVGNTDQSLQHVADESGLPERSVSFKGEIPYEEVAKEMQSADCFVLFSQIENSPCVIGEALCCGLPVIATRVGGIPELVDVSAALLVGAGDEASLADSMEEMIKNQSRYDRKKIAENAKSKFSYAVVGKKFDEIYNALPAG